MSSITQVTFGETFPLNRFIKTRTQPEKHMYRWIAESEATNVPGGLNVNQLPGPILVVAPHPDDDVLSAGGLIQQALRLSKTVYVLFVTAGDANGQSVLYYLHRRLSPAAYRQLGHVRHMEAIRAERFLGTPSRNLFFLGFPDGIMYDIAVDNRINRIHRSTYTRFSRAEYSFAYRRNAPYTHQQAVNLMKSVLVRTRPRTIILNLGVDIHPDHRGTRLLMLEAIRTLRLNPILLLYLIHFPNWPNRMGLLKSPNGVHIPGETILLLSRQESIKTFRAYQLEASQARLHPNNDNLIRQNELFWRQDALMV